MPHPFEPITFGSKPPANPHSWDELAVSEAEYPDIDDGQYWLLPSCSFAVPAIENQSYLPIKRETGPSHKGPAPSRSRSQRSGR